MCIVPPATSSPHSQGCGREICFSHYQPKPLGAGQAWSTHLCPHHNTPMPEQVTSCPRVLWEEMLQNRVTQGRLQSHFITVQSLLNSTFKSQVSKEVEEVWKTVGGLMWPRAWHANRAEPAQTHFLSITTSFLPHLPFIPVVVVVFFRSFILTPLDLCLNFQLLFWSLKRALLYLKGNATPDGLGGNMARMWNSEEKWSN